MKSHGADMTSKTKRITPLWRQLALISILFVSLAACGDDDIGRVTDGTLSITPSPLNFADVVIGESSLGTIRLLNDGDSTIRLADLELVDNPNRSGNADAYELLNPWSDTYVLEPGDSYELDIEYAPTGTVPSEGLVTFRTNLANDTDIEVEVRANAPRPELLAEEVVIFDRTPAGSTEWRLTRIQNVGSADLEIDDIELAGPEDFQMTFPAATGTDVDGPSDDDITYRDTVAAGESLWLRIHYTAPDDQFQTAQINIESNDPDKPRHMIAVIANSDAPCLRLVGDEVDFGLASIGNATTETVTLHNCSRVAHTVVSDIALGEYIGDGGQFEEGGDIHFEIDPASLPQELQDEGIKAIPPNESISFRIRYSPQFEQEDLATLQVVSNDEAGPIQARVVGNGADLECPVAIAQGRIAGEGVWSDDWIFGAPLDVVELDGSQSYDPDETDVTYEWSLLEQPAGSIIQINGANTANPTLETDIAGTFVIELSVYDDFGISSCEPATLNVSIEPESAIHVELTWEVPSSPDGTGTDLDLHYLHPYGDWSVHPYGVFWNNPEPNWNDGSTVSLDIDDLTGDLPENINHDNPDPTFDYSIGIFYFSDTIDFGATDARLRIYLGGDLVLDEERRMNNPGNGNILSTTGDFWHAADILVEHGGVLDLDFVDNFYEDGGIPQ